MAKVFLRWVKLANFRQIWSHWLLHMLSEGQKSKLLPLLLLLQDPLKTI